MLTEVPSPSRRGGEEGRGGGDRSEHGYLALKTQNYTQRIYFREIVFNLEFGSQRIISI